MKKVKSNFIKISPIIGIGYWKDVFKGDVLNLEGVSHNLILPFIRWQWGYLINNENKNKNK